MSDPKVIEERPYTIPFYPKLNSIPRNKRAPRAMRLLREFMERHMKSSDLIIDEEVNEKIWSRGIQKPPRKISVLAAKYDDDVVKVSLAETVYQEVFAPETKKGPGLPSSAEIENEEDFEEEDED